MKSKGGSMKFYLSLVLLSFCFFSLGAQDSFIEYKVKPGDTLSKISKEHLSNSENWRELLQYNKIDTPNKIVPGLVLKIPGYLAKPELGLAPAAPVSAETIARLEFKGGEVKFKGEKDKDFKAVVAKQEFQSGDLIQTSSSASAQIRFLKEPQAVLKLKGNTQLKVSDDGNLKMVEMKTGDLFVEVANKAKSNTEKLKVATNTSVAGVRGTQFDVAIDKNGNDSYSCYEGLMQVSAQGVVTELPAGFGTSVKKGEPPQKPVKLLHKVKILPPEKPSK